MKISNRNKKKNKKPFFVYDSHFSSDKKIFLENFGLMLSSGVGIVEILESLREQMSSKKAKYILGQIAEDVRNGIPITESLVEYKFVSENFLKIIRIGETSGNLAENLEIVINQQRRDTELKSKLTSASIYPVFVLVLMLAVGTGIFTFVLPRLTTVYESLNVDLPFLTRVFIDMGKFLESNGYYVVPAFLTLLFCFTYLIFYDKKSRKIGQYLLYHIPPVRRLVQEVELARFGYLMGSVLSKGISVPESLDLLEKSTIFYQFKNFYRYLKFGIYEGKNFKTLFDEYKKTKQVLPVYVRQLITTAEKTGGLPDAFSRIGKTYAFKVNITSKNLSALFEPVLLLSVWVGVAFVALAVILPIYSIIGNFNSIASNPSATSSEDLYNSALETSNNDIALPFYVRPINANIYATDVVYGTNSVLLLLDNRYQVIEVSEDWYQISFDDDSFGWVNKANVEIIF